MELLTFQASSPVSEAPCQCQACIQQSVASVAAASHPALAQPLPASTRPAALHLYGHLHTGQQGALAGHMRPPPLIQPHLYELHSHSAAKATPNKHNFSLDLDSHQALHEHIYHAYGDWENTFDGATDYGGGLSASELFNQPTPPLLNGNPYMDPHLSQTETATSKAATLLSHGVCSAKAAVTQTVSSSGGLVGTSGNEHVHTEACFKTLKPINRTLAQPTQKTTVAPFKGTLPSLTTAPSSVSAAVPHTDHCLKHNPFLHTHHSSFSGTQGTTTVTSTAAPAQLQHPMKLPEPPNLNLNLGHQMSPHMACNHQHSHGHPAPVSAPPPAAPQPPPAAPITGACNDPECDGHHEDNYDSNSMDDSCSEKSSSTSTSNQKDGKYCDCCYCEFFGHSNVSISSAQWLLIQ